MANNISTYSAQIAVPNATMGPRAEAADFGVAGLVNAGYDALNAFTRAKQASENQNARVSAVTQLDDLAQELGRDPDYATAVPRYETQASAIGEQLRPTFSTDAQRAAFDNDFQLLSHSRRLSLQDVVYAKDRDTRRGQLDMSLDDFAKQAARAGNALEYQAVVGMGLKNIEDMVAGGFLTEQEGAHRKIKFSGDLDETSALQMIGANPAGVAKKLKDPDFLPALDPQARIRLTLSAEAQVRAAEREAAARARESAAMARSSLSDAMAVIRSGLPVDPSLIHSAAAAAAASGDRELLSHAQEIGNLAIWQDAVRKATPAQLHEELTRISDGANKAGATAATATQYTIGRQILDKMTGELARDPLSWASAQGVTDVEPISFQGDAGTEALASRAASAHQVAGYYGVAPKFFTDAERSSLQAALKDAPAQSQLALATSIVKGMGPDAPKALGEISSNAPVFAHLGGLLATGPQYAATVEAGFDGAKAIAEKANVVPGGRKLDTAISDVLGTALDERQGATRRAAIESAKAIYTSEALKRGLTAEAFNEGLFEDALQKSLGQWRDGNGDEKGGVGRFNGGDVVLPTFMSNGDLKDTIRGLDDKALTALSARGGAPVHGDGSKASADELRDAWLVTVGPGLYQISMTDPRYARELLKDDKSGGYYLLDLSDKAKIDAVGVKPKKAGSWFEDALHNRPQGLGLVP